MEWPFPYVLTVTELTEEIKEILEERFPDIWVEGEISNLRTPSSGHLYFTLKDDFSQIRAVLFKSQARALRFMPEDGLQVLCRGRVSLYEKRGEYQIILEAIQPKGIGELQLAFLQLRERLEREGLFDSARKKPLPMIPQKIGIVTSPTGAVIQDMIQIIHRRFENVHILLYPVRVQGEGASQEISDGIDYFNAHTDADVVIVGRGGGSLEDLWPFNEELVARAIARSRIPILSAVGHETDYTIADFVADVRAPTPSAAAELVVREKREIKNTISHLRNRLEGQILRVLQAYRTELSHVTRILGDPRRTLQEWALRLDDLENRLQVRMRWVLERKKGRWVQQDQGLLLCNPVRTFEKLRALTSQTRKRLDKAIDHSLQIRRQRLGGIIATLNSLSPLAILERGYSITRRFPTLEILRRSSQVKEGDSVEVQLHRGSLICGVQKTRPP